MLSAVRKRLARQPAPGPRWEQLGEADEYRALFRVRTEHAVEVREPLVLVSQVQRSGGTLLSRLFDGHPECHAHPRCLWIGYPSSRHWPPIASTPPERWFEILYEKKSGIDLREGYDNMASAEDPDVFPFLFLPRLQKAIFDHRVATSAPASEREVLDCYFTSYFNAWLDNQNLFTRPKKVVTGFVPLLSMDLENVTRFFAAYPDGTLISIVRDPLGWFNSARKLKVRYQDPSRAIRTWRKSTKAAVEARERFGDRVIVLTYRDLVLETETAMERLAERLGLTMSPILLEPSFNGRPIRANSSNRVTEYGILPERAGAFRASLDEETIGLIEGLAGDLYERASASSMLVA